MKLSHPSPAPTTRARGLPAWAWLVLWLVAACTPTEGARDEVPVIILPREVEQLDPRYVGDAYGVKLSRLVHASLMTIDPVSLEVVPDLAETLSLEGPTTYRVTLRPNQRFADGSALEADDVVATFRALVDPAVESRYASTFARIAEVRAEGPLTVVFELDAPHATFATDLEIPVLRAEDAFSVPRDGPLVGAGPFVVAARSAGEILLRENRHYRRAPLRHRELRFVVIRDDNTRALRLLGGGGDLALNAIPPLLLPLFERRSDFRVRSAPGVGTTYVGINLEDAVLKRSGVRRALAHAIDRESIVRHKLAGRARLASSWIVPGHWAHAQDCQQIAFDPRRAEALLEAEGFSRAGDGMRLSLTMRTGSDRFAVSITRAMAAMWRAVGIDVEVRPSEQATLLADLGKGRFQLTFLQVPEVFEPHVLSWFFASDHIPEAGVQEGANRWRLRSDELDRALEAGRRTPQQRLRVPFYHEAQHILARELPVIPLWHENVVAVTSPRLLDFVVPRDGRFGTLSR